MMQALRRDVANVHRRTHPNVLKVVQMLHVVGRVRLVGALYFGAKIGVAVFVLHRFKAALVVFGSILRSVKFVCCRVAHGITLIWGTRLRRVKRVN